MTQGEDDELLITQKAFDGFDDTRERLDLSALIVGKQTMACGWPNTVGDSGKELR